MKYFIFELYIVFEDFEEIYLILEEKDVELKKNIIDDNYSVYEDDRFHKLGTDSVLLAKFVNVKKNLKICDLGVGQGGLSLLLFIKESNLEIHGVEIEPETARIAEYNMQISGFSDKFTLHICDMRELEKDMYNKFDMVVSNPPYFKNGCGKQSKTSERDFARLDCQCSALELCKTASKLLKSGGDFYLVYRSDRICDIISSMRKCKIEPKKIQFVYGNAETNSKIVLIYGKKCGGEGACILPPLFLK